MEGMGEEEEEEVGDGKRLLASNPFL